MEYAKSNKTASLIEDTIESSMIEGSELKRLYDEDPEIKRVIDTAKCVEGIKCGIGMHAAGVIISYKPLDQIVPVQPSKDGIIITQYHREILEKMKLLKMDFLGLRNLTMIHKTVKLIQNVKGLMLISTIFRLMINLLMTCLFEGKPLGYFS